MILGFPQWAHDHTQRILNERARVLEIVCWRALEGGLCGVLVDYTKGYAKVDWRVPYGQIYDVSACGEENVQWSALPSGGSIEI